MRSRGWRGRRGRSLSRLQSTPTQPGDLRILPIFTQMAKDIERPLTFSRVEERPWTLSRVEERGKTRIQLSILGRIQEYGLRPLASPIATYHLQFPTDAEARLRGTLWRNMFICQPPSTLVTLDVHLPDEWSFNILRDDGGVRLGKIVDMLQDMLTGGPSLRRPAYYVPNTPG